MGHNIRYFIYKEDIDRKAVQRKQLSGCRKRQTHYGGIILRFDIFNTGSALGTIGSVLVAILVLLFMVTVHEAGHYFAGKAFGFKINEFAIGMGPAIFKKKLKKM